MGSRQGCQRGLGLARRSQGSSVSTIFLFLPSLISCTCTLIIIFNLCTIGRSLITYETSYIPFLFSDPSDSPSTPSKTKLRGRRTFDNQGQEVLDEVRDIFVLSIPPFDHPIFSGLTHRRTQQTETKCTTAAKPQHFVLKYQPPIEENGQTTCA